MGAVDAARALGAGRALRAWGDAIATCVDDLARGTGGTRPPSIEAAAARLVPVERATLQTAGWELRHAMAWRNDGRCLQRAAFAALSVSEREAGGIAPAVGRLASDDAAAGAMVVAYDPSRMSMTRFHAAEVSRTVDDELLVIDHLVADSDDGVLALDDWLGRIGARHADSTILSPLREPPSSLGHTGPGIPSSARVRPSAQWRELADHLAIGWDDAAAARQSNVVPYRPR